jgi:hypothetical protein
LTNYDILSMISLHVEPMISYIMVYDIIFMILYNCDIIDMI